MVRQRWKYSFLFAIGLCFILLLHGAVPFVAVPTLGQAVWATGFSQSFVNNSIFSIHATNFGLPEPAVPAFGLAGVYPAGLLIAAGLHPADAYSLMAAMWLTLAFFGAWRFGLHFGLSSPLATFGAIFWMSMPIIWAHAYYSMLSLGIALFPFYFWHAMRIFEHPIESNAEKIKRAGFYLGACVVAVFMDGYTFVMFAVGSTILSVCIFLRQTVLRRHFFYFTFPIHIFSFAVAYLLYVWYVGRLQFDPPSLNFFRSFGVDLSFLAIPTRGILWLWDTIGFSVPRTDITFFGDGSVWITTFCMPLIILGFVAWWKTRSHMRLSNAFLLLALFGFYMALGPSLKLNTTKPERMQQDSPGQSSALMLSEDLSVVPTGNAWLYENVPGLNNMRAVYRWSALGVFGFWVLLLIWLKESNGSGKVVVLTTMGILLLSNLPHVERKWVEDKKNHDKFKRIDHDLVTDMEKTLRKGELVAFLPYGNDFLVNYVASRINIRTYNIGGDKNLVIASQYWPQAMRNYGMNRIDSDLSEIVLSLLSARKADAIVLPYIDMLKAAYNWPVPLKYKGDLGSVIDTLMDSGRVIIDKRSHYSVVRLTTDQPCLPFIYPLNVAKRSGSLYRVLRRGWHNLEREHVWSKQYAELELPIPQGCSPDKCSAVLTFRVFGASEKRPVHIIFKSANKNSGTFSIVANNGAEKRVNIPLPISSSSNILNIEIPEAVSPNKLYGSSDKRVLGIALYSIELKHHVK